MTPPSRARRSLLAAAPRPRRPHPLPDELPQRPDVLRRDAGAGPSPPTAASRAGRAAGARSAASSAPPRGKERDHRRGRRRATRPSTSARSRARARLGGSRRTELGAVIAPARVVRRAADCSPSRGMPVLFRQLEREHATGGRRTRRPPPPKPPPGEPAVRRRHRPGRRARRRAARPSSSGTPGQGLQIQQLAHRRPGERARQGVHRAEPEARVRPRRGSAAAMDALVVLAVDRGGFRAWEYYFAFGGGRAAVDQRPGAGHGDAGARARLAGARATRATSRSRAARVGAFERRAAARRARPRRRRRRTTSSTRSTRGLRVLNAFLQALVGLYDYAEVGRRRPRRGALFARGERQARAGGARAPTPARGRATARAARSPTSATTGCVRDFLRSLCDRTKGARVLRDRRALHRVPDASARGCASCRRPRTRAARDGDAVLPVEDLVRDAAGARGGRPVATVTRVLGRGAQTLGWVAAARGQLRRRGRRRATSTNHFTRDPADGRASR